jgi:hypothetical protein
MVLINIVILIKLEYPQEAVSVVLLARDVAFLFPPGLIPPLLTPETLS